MTRAERRRIERELARILPQAGLGLGWRYTVNSLRRYPVYEPPERGLEYLEMESDAARERAGLYFDPLTEVNEMFHGAFR